MVGMALKFLHHQLSPSGITKMLSNSVVNVNHCCESVEGCESGRILLSIPGIGIINASAFLAAIDKGQAFSNPKELAVWLGLTPKQHASHALSIFNLFAADPSQQRCVCH
jgi:hypothetical protein